MVFHLLLQFRIVAQKTVNLLIFVTQLFLKVRNLNFEILYVPIAVIDEVLEIFVHFLDFVTQLSIFKLH